MPEDAFQQFKDTEDWRVANDIDVLYRTIDVSAYEQSRRLVRPFPVPTTITQQPMLTATQYPQWTGRRDRRGIPLYVFEVRSLDSKTISEYEKSGANSTFSEAKTDGKTAPGLLRLFALYENLTRFSQPFCSQLTDREYPDVPITLSTNIVDISGVGLKQFWNLKSHMQAASQLATAHYPETLDRIFIIGAPVFFSTVWGWIKRWFDPITVSKIFILDPSEVKSTLEGFIEPRNIPKKYGGELDFAFGRPPVPDSSWEGVISWEKGYSIFPTGPLLWEEIDGGKRLACVSYGTEGGEKRTERVCTLPRVWPPQEEEKKVNGVAGDDKTEEKTAEPAATEPEATNEDAVTNGKDMEKLNIADEAEKQKDVAPSDVAPAIA